MKVYGPLSLCAGVQPPVPNGTGVAVQYEVGIDRRKRELWPAIPAAGGHSPNCVRSNAWLTIDRITRMKILGYVYRIVSNFAFLALVYYSLNFMEKYQHRAIVAILVLVYASMRAVSALRSFYFFQKIERLELEARRLAGLAAEGPAAAAARKQIVARWRRFAATARSKSYIDLFFLAMVVLLCVAKIVTD